MAGKTTFDRRLDACVELARGVAAMEYGKLSGSAFIVDACKSGGCTVADVDRLAVVLSAAPGNAASAFVNTTARNFAEPVFKRAPPAAKHTKILMCYGSAEVIGEIAAAGSTLGAAIALAAKQSVARWPDRFGRIDNMDRHAKVLADAKARLADMIDKLRENYAPHDLIVHADHLTDAERSAGLAKICFKRAPNISPGHSNWPGMLVSALVAARAEPVLVPPHDEAERGESERAVAAGGGIRRRNAAAEIRH